MTLEEAVEVLKQSGLIVRPFVKIDDITGFDNYLVGGLSDEPSLMWDSSYPFWLWRQYEKWGAHTYRWQLSVILKVNKELEHVIDSLLHFYQLQKMLPFDPRDLLGFFHYYGIMTDIVNNNQINLYFTELAQRKNEFDYTDRIAEWSAGHRNYPMQVMTFHDDMAEVGKLQFRLKAMKDSEIDELVKKIETQHAAT